MQLGPRTCFQTVAIVKLDQKITGLSRKSCPQNNYIIYREEFNPYLHSSGIMLGQDFL